MGFGKVYGVVHFLLLLQNRELALSTKRVKGLNMGDPKSHYST